MIPTSLDLAQAAPVLCAGVTVWKAIKQSNTKPGDFILVGVVYRSFLIVLNGSLDRLLELVEDSDT